MTKILVTGCMGFIGSYFVKFALRNTHYSIVGFSRNSDQKNLHRLDEVLSGENKAKYEDRFHLIYGDMSNGSDISGLCEDVDYVVNFGAKTFVDHSIRDAEPFVKSNIVGTYNLLEDARRYYVLNKRLKRFIQVSTDEVYGAILEGAYKEDARLNPTNPYSASKAGGDMLALAYYHTYGLPIVITRTENNFGPWQHPQKAMPKFVKNALESRKLPIYGDGEHRRMWLFVEDHCLAILHLLTHGRCGEVYHVAGEQELTNNQLAVMILRMVGKNEDEIPGLIEHIEDYNIRPGHDRRYALNVDKLKGTGWKPKYNLDDAMKETVHWYVENSWWLK